MPPHALAIANQQAIIEFAGVFWLAAECFIYLLMRAAKRHTQCAPLPPAFRLTRIEKKLLVALAAIATVLLVALPGRFLYASETIDALNSLDIAAVTETYKNLTRPHLLLWSTFILGWVALEALIVWTGIGVYRNIRDRLNEA